MSFFSRLFGRRATTTNDVDTCAFFVFDYEQMDSQYGYQAFKDIYDALRGSLGLCAFYHGDVFDVENVRMIAQQGTLVRPSSGTSPLANLSGDFRCGAYFAAMFSDHHGNFEKLNSGLLARRTPGYLGYISVGCLEAEEALDLFQRLSLPRCIALRDGEIVPGTSTWGIGSNPADNALIQAAAIGDVGAARRALDDGANVECVDSYEDPGATPIIFASQTKDAAVVSLLLDSGADPNVLNSGGNSPLMLAARFGLPETVRVLIDGGADVNLSSGGYTALDEVSMARKGDDPTAKEIRQILQSAGARERS